MYIGTGFVILIFCDFLKNRTFFIQKVYFGRYQHFSKKYSVTYIYIYISRDGISNYPNILFNVFHCFPIMSSDDLVY